MDESTSREKILKKVRKALIEKGDSGYLNADFKTSIFKTKADADEIIFAQNLLLQNGNFIYCENETEAFQQLRNLFESNQWSNPVFEEEEIFYYFQKSRLNDFQEKNSNKQIAITLCECLVASTGSVAISSSQNCNIRAFIENEIHIVFAFTWQIVPNISDALLFIQKKYPNNQSRQITFISGPSRTADIEQQIVFGAHGPKELYVFLLDE